MDALDWILLIVIIVVSGSATIHKRPIRNLMPKSGDDGDWYEKGGDRE